MKYTAFLVLLFIVPAFPAYADYADVIEADIKYEGDSRYTFFVTVSHKDTGWDHYADRWEILTLDDEVITGRVLRHPHVGQQSFTRPLHFVSLPDDISQVKIRAHCTRDGFGGKTMEIGLPERR
ncbi:MAG TPA: hypothetical protein VLN56_01095 [Gammaproteobacteria bacterium]|nr:hypothetical protein [Gammaproteobacteria bacterium]